jgi:hypothetical protein
LAGVPWPGQPEVPAVETNPVNTDAMAPMGTGLAQMAAVSTISTGSPGGTEAIISTVPSSPLGRPELQISATAVPESMPEALAQNAASLVGQTLDQVSGDASDSIVRAGSDTTSFAAVGVTQDSASQIKVSAALLQGERVTGSEAIHSAGVLSAGARHTSPENAGVGAIAHRAQESVLQSDASTNSLPLALATAARDTSDSNNIQSLAGAQPVRVAEVNQASPVLARVQQIEATDLAQLGVELEGVVNKATDVGASGPQPSVLPMPSVLPASVVTEHPVGVATSSAQELASPVLNSNETNSGATMVAGQTGQDMMPSAPAIQSLATPADEGVAPPFAKSLASGVEGSATKVMATSRHAVMDLQASTTTTTSPREPLSPPVLVQAAADMAAAGVVQTPRAQSLDRGQDGVRQEADRSQTEATPSSDAEPAFNLFAAPAQTVKEGAESVDAARAGSVGSSPVSSVQERAPSVEMLQTASVDESAGNTSASGTDSSFTHSFMQTLMGHSPAASALAEHRVLEPDVTPSALAPHQVQLDAGPVHVEIVRLVKQGGGQVVLALTPPDQTTFKIDLSIDAQGVARLVVDGGSDSTRSRLEQGVTQLQEQFTQMGLQLQFDMRQQRDDTRAQDQAWASGHPGGAPVEASHAKSDTIARPRPVPANWAQGQVHLYA